MRSHRKQPRHKQAMPHSQKFQHSTCILIHQLASLVVHVLGLSDGWCELGSWGFARHPFFHEQYAGSIQSENSNFKKCKIGRASLRSLTRAQMAAYSNARPSLRKRKASLLRIKEKYDPPCWLSLSPK